MFVLYSSILLFVVVRDSVSFSVYLVHFALLSFSRLTIVLRNYHEWLNNQLELRQSVKKEREKKRISSDLAPFIN